MVLFDAPTWPGVVIPSRPIGVVCLVQREDGEKKPKRNDRIIAVPASDERYKSTNDLPKRMCEELEQFFVAASRMSGKTVEIQGWQGPKHAVELIEKAEQLYMRKGPPE